jgi:hypothetical protein
LRSGCPFRQTLLDKSIGENDLREFDSKVIFIRSSILGNGWSDANRWNGDVLPDIFFWTTKIGS